MSLSPRFPSRQIAHVATIASALLLIGAMPQSAHAQQLTYLFTGAITSISDPEGLLTGPYQLNVGDALNGSYRFDPTLSASDFFQLNPQTRIYDGPTLSGGGIRINTGNLHFTPAFIPSTWFFVGDDVPGLGDRYGVQTNYAISEVPAMYDIDFTGYEYNRIQMNFFDPTGTAVNSQGFPGSVPDINAYSQREGQILFINPDSFTPAATIRFSINGLSAAPEPGAFALLATGLLPLAGGVLRRRKAA